MQCTDFSYATIATVCDDGTPWNTPVVVRFDANGFMYWVSAISSRHSCNIARRPDIFVVCFDSSAPEGTGEGLYMRMRAEMLTTAGAIAAAKRTYDTSFFVHDASHQQFLEHCPQRLYRARPVAVWRNDGTTQDGHYIDVRRQVMMFPKE